MEAYDQGYGCILYRTTIPAGPAATLEAATVHDFGFVFVDGKRAGTFDRRSGSFKLSLPERSQAARLDILVEPMGRVNFGEGMVDRKGLIAPVKLNTAVLSDWKIYRLPLDRKMLGKLKWKHQPATGPAFWRGTFTLEEPGDTFLDLHNWGKGDLWVNGHCLGRYWNIGPTQTAYLPGCWLHAGQNEIVILDLLGPTQPVVAGLDQPVLDELRPELDFAKAHRPNVRLHLDGVVPAIKGSFASGADPQTVKLDAPVSGRFFCLKSLNAHDGKPYAAVAELDLLDTAGNTIAHDGWTIAYVDSEERNGEDGSAENAIDGQTANFWHTEWKNNSPDHPHYLILNLGQTREISGFRYVPRQSPGAGRIKDYEVIIGDHLVEPVKK
jgi:beta-galactosidase